MQSAPKLPPVAQETKPPKATDTAVQQAVAEAARRRAGARGYRSTILSRDFMSDDSQSLMKTLGP